MQDLLITFPVFRRNLNCIVFCTVCQFTLCWGFKRVLKFAEGFVPLI